MKKGLFVLISVLMTLPAWADVPPLPDAKVKLADPSEAPLEPFNPEEKPARPTEGPHKGHLVAAANYNLEVIWENDSAKIYLLDADFKNPVVQGSEMGVFIKSGNTESEMNCLIVEDYFECKQNGKKFKKGQLAISSKRSGVQAEEVKVEVPFEKKAEKPKDVKKKK